MKEVEVKIIEIDREMVERKLRSLGGVRIFEGDEETVFFDFPAGSITASKDLLRLRKIGDKTTLTFKKFVGDDQVKVRDEVEVSVSGFESMRRILESLGLRAIQRTEKHRTSYSLGTGLRVDFDEYAGELSHIPELMEIEGGDAAAVLASAKLLGFKPEDCKSWTTSDLIDHYSAKKVET